MASYNLLEENITKGLSANKLEFDTNKTVDLLTTTSFLYTTAIMLIIGVAAARYMLAGVWRMEASERGVRRSKEEIQRVTLGLIGVLSLFVILYTFNKGLLRGDVGLKNLESKKVAVSGVGGTTAATPTPAISTPTTNGTEKANRDALAAVGITVNKDPCTPEQMQEAKPSCTNLADLGQSAMSMLVQLRDSCPGANITVTGGTEPGHKSHGPGKSVVDLRIGTPVLDACISKKGSPGPDLNFCIGTWVWLGFVFCNEKNTSHWHVFK